MDIFQWSEKKSWKVNCDVQHYEVCRVNVWPVADGDADREQSSEHICYDP